MAQVRFDHFMAAALYDPERGYYSRRIKTVGERGDFTTTPQLSPLLAKAIAQQFRSSGYQHLIEVGPGSGLLAEQIRQALPWHIRRRTKQHLVEISPLLRKIQQERIPKASHHSALSDALQKSNGNAFIYSNELVDAFPVRRFRWSGEEWHEHHLETNEGLTKNIFFPTPDLPSSLLLKANYPTGQIVEIHESYQQWLNAQLINLNRGQLLTIDYVAPSPRPLLGTIRGYFQHQRIQESDIIRNAGHVDITCDVHFPDLITWGKEQGLRTLSHETQTEFLSPFRASGSDSMADPQAAGAAFEVLLQER